METIIKCLIIFIIIAGLWVWCAVMDEKDNNPKNHEDFNIETNDKEQPPI